jgi:hypothetical protein
MRRREFITLLTGANLLIDFICRARRDRFHQALPDMVAALGWQIENEPHQPFIVWA